ncbi:MAG: hypothetical protein ACTS5I_05640 [Rhodanobacter sp.]
MAPVEKVAAFAAALIPPITATPKVQHQWRVRVGVVVCAMFCAWLYVIAGVVGWVPSIVARAGDIAEIDGKLKLLAQQVQAVADESRNTRLSMLVPQILDMQTRYCGTQGHADQAAMRTLYRRQVDDLLDEYLNLKGKPFRLPSCGEL